MVIHVNGYVNEVLDYQPPSPLTLHCFTPVITLGEFLALGSLIKFNSSKQSLFFLVHVTFSTSANARYQKEFCSCAMFNICSLSKRVLNVILNWLTNQTETESVWFGCVTSSISFRC